MALFAFIALLILCTYQDIRFRGIHWVIFPLILLGAIVLRWDELNPITLIWNAGFLLFLLLGLTLYLSVKEQRLVNITNGYFATGDVLFLIAIIPLFTFHWFVLFFTIGTLLTLVFHLVASMIKPQKTIPYAGYLAIVGIGYVTFSNQLHQLILLD